MDITPDLRTAAARLRAVLDAPELPDEMLVDFYAKQNPNLEAGGLAAHMRRVAEQLAQPFDPPDPLRRIGRG